jgi:hypothetical protein
MMTVTQSTTRTLDGCKSAIEHLAIIADTVWVSDAFTNSDIQFIVWDLSHVTLTVSGTCCLNAVPGKNKLLVSLFDERFMEVSTPNFPHIFHRLLVVFTTFLQHPRESAHNPSCGARQ